MRATAAVSDGVSGGRRTIWNGGSQAKVDSVAEGRGKT